MPEFLDGWPLVGIFSFMFALAMFRGQALYWLGRVITEQTLRRTRPTRGWKARAHAWLTGGGIDPGIVALRRWGLIAVPFSYLTVGFQSMIQAAAGVVRIELWKYLIAQIPGALVWASIYTTFGFVTWFALGAAARGNPWAAAGVALVVGITLTVLIMARRRSGRPPVGGVPEPESNLS
ncbi:MAG: DedA family protein [Beutenbergiaceae bacterium]